MGAAPTFGRKWGKIVGQSPTLMAENVGIMGKNPHFWGGGKRGSERVCTYKRRKIVFTCHGWC